MLKHVDILPTNRNRIEKKNLKRDPIKTNYISFLREGD